jgi:hypothetical protein
MEPPVVLGQIRPVALAQILAFLGVLVFAAASFFFALAESALFSSPAQRQVKGGAWKPNSYQ